LQHSRNWLHSAHSSKSGAAVDDAENFFSYHTYFDTSFLKKKLCNPLYNHLQPLPFWFFMFTFGKNLKKSMKYFFFKRKVCSLKIRRSAVLHYRIANQTELLRLTLDWNWIFDLIFGLIGNCYPRPQIRQTELLSSFHFISFNL